MNTPVGHIPCQIIAHRGASWDAPENTIAGFRLAWAQHADAVECDIRLSRDGRILVMHDPTSLRTTGVEYALAECSSGELGNLDAGRWKSPAYAGERVPFLEEVLETVPSGKKLFIEVKCGAEILPVLEKVLPDDSPSFCTLMGFDGGTVAILKKRFPEHRVLWLCEFPRRAPITGAVNNTEALIEQAKALRVDGINVRNRGMTDDCVRLVREAGLGLYVWTVNNVREAVRFLSWDVDGITTDRPGWIREHLSARGLRSRGGYR